MVHFSRCCHDILQLFLGLLFVSRSECMVLIFKNSIKVIGIYVSVCIKIIS